MNLMNNMVWSVPTVPAGRATGTLSGVQDCRGYDRCRIWAQQLKQGTGAKAAKIVFRVQHFTASATYASSTAFTTALGVSAAALSATRAIGFDIALDGVGPFLVYKLSTATTSAVVGVIATPYSGKYNPTGTSTTGISGFTALTFSPAQP